MNGATFEEIEEALLYGHEVEFAYKGNSYTMEPDKENGKKIIQIWMYSKNDTGPIAKIFFGKIEDLKILFNIKCFDGKSFYEIEKEVTVEYIF